MHACNGQSGYFRTSIPSLPGPKSEIAYPTHLCGQKTSTKRRDMIPLCRQGN